MKIFILFLSCLLTGPAFVGSIEESEVPPRVKAYVSTHYPQAKGIEWDFEEEEGVYEAEFKIGSLSYKLEILPEGVLHASKEDIPISSLPAAITQYIAANYPDAKILGANKKVKGKTIIFDVGIKGKNASGHTRYRNICFDGEGKVIASPASPGGAK